MIYLQKKTQSKIPQGGKHHKWDMKQNWTRRTNTYSEHEDHNWETFDNDPTKTANKRRLKKGTNQDGTGGRTQTL